MPRATSRWTPLDGLRQAIGNARLAAQVLDRRIQRGIVDDEGTERLLAIVTDETERMARVIEHLRDANRNVTDAAAA